MPLKEIRTKINKSILACTSRKPSVKTDQLQLVDLLRKGGGMLSVSGEVRIPRR